MHSAHTYHRTVSQQGSCGGTSASSQRLAAGQPWVNSALGRSQQRGKPSCRRLHPTASEVSCKKTRFQLSACGGVDGSNAWADFNSADRPQTSGREHSDLDVEWQEFVRCPRFSNSPHNITPGNIRSCEHTHLEHSAAGPSVHSVDDWDATDDEVYVPLPSNLPVNETHSTNVGVWPSPSPSQRSFKERTGIDMLMGKAFWSGLKEVYVILFGVGEKDTEGIYSLRAMSDDGLSQETIIAFEIEEDAERYAALLEATMDHVPNVCSIPPQELLEFCVDAGYNCRLEPKGSLLIPPDYNVGVTDWERSLRLREGHWSVLESEPERVVSTWGSGRFGSSACEEPSVQRVVTMQFSPLDESELNYIRARLESLLPSESE